MSKLFGTRRDPSRLRLWAIAGAVFIAVVLVLSMCSTANAAPVHESTGVSIQQVPAAGCYKNGAAYKKRESYDCGDRFSSGPFSRKNSEKMRKYGGAVGLGCAAGFAAASGPGAAYGCIAAGLGAAWDWYLSD